MPASTINRELSRSKPWPALAVAMGSVLAMGAQVMVSGELSRMAGVSRRRPGKKQLCRIGVIAILVAFKPCWPSEQQTMLLWFVSGAQP